MSGDGRDFVRRAACLGQSTRGCFSQAMRRALWQACFLAYAAEPIAKPISSERLAEFGGDERQIICRGVGQDRGEFWQNRNIKLRAGLYLAHMNVIAPDVLSPHSDNIGDALAGAEQQCESQSLPCPDRILRLELFDFVVSPRMNPGGLHPNCFHVARGIVLANTCFNRVLHHRSQHLTQSVGAVGLVGALCHQLYDVFALHCRRRHVAICRAVGSDLTAEAVDKEAVAAANGM
jgi:hypothetical protein